jgi:hypothetical protein
VDFLTLKKYKMLFGKILPEAIVANLNGPFDLQTSFAQYMTAIANPYRLGDNTVNFSIYYGNFITNEETNQTTFTTFLTNTCVLSGTAIQNWGTDDTYILNQIAIQQGTTVVEYVENDIVVG